jgi:hypothetical protein
MVRSFYTEVQLFVTLLFKEVVVNMEPYSPLGYGPVVGLFEYGSETLLYVKLLDHYHLVVNRLPLTESCCLVDGINF